MFTRKTNKGRERKIEGAQHRERQSGRHGSLKGIMH